MAKKQCFLLKNKNKNCSGYTNFKLGNNVRLFSVDVPIPYKILSKNRHLDLPTRN